MDVSLSVKRKEYGSAGSDLDNILSGMDVEKHSAKSIIPQISVARPDGIGTPSCKRILGDYAGTI